MITRRYLFVWIWLLALMTLSLFLGVAPVARNAAVTLMFTVAAIKTVLVALHFMHLKIEPWLIYAIALVPVVMVVGFMLTLFPDFVFHR